MQSFETRHSPEFCTPLNMPVLRLEEARDGRQGEYPSSALELFGVIRDTWPHCSMVALGWPYIDLAHAAVADYLRQHSDDLSKYPAFNRERFFVYTLIHLGDGQVDASSPFGKMLADMRANTQPYGTVNILTKARVADVSMLSAEMDSERMRRHVKSTMQLLARANPEVKIELALEHLYSAWLESADSRQHILSTIRDYLIEVKRLLGESGLACARITAPDTDGAHNQSDITAVIGALVQALQQDPNLINSEIAFHPGMLIAHMHEDLGLSIENSLAACAAGAGAVDLNLTPAGERMGNASMVEFLRTCGASAEHLKQFQRMATKISFWYATRTGDKAVGSPSAFVATGGMHAATILKAYLEQNQHGVTWSEFCKGFRGSYAGVPADRFGQSLSVALSPVAGAANVLFMLAGLGYDITCLDKRDPRIAEVLSIVKDSEFMFGENYRGYNNVNAFLLLAQKFGLRNHHHCFGTEEGIASNDLRLSYELREGYDSSPRSFVELSLSTNEMFVEPLVQRYEIVSGRATLDDTMHYLDDSALEKLLLDINLGVPEGADREIMLALIYERAGDLKLAQELCNKIRRDMSPIHNDFNAINIVDSRRWKIDVGAIKPGGADSTTDVLNPVSADHRCGFKLIFTIGTEEHFQANGMGSNYEQALIAAFHAMLDYVCFRIERDCLKKGSSPLLELWRKLERQRHDLRTLRISSATGQPSSSSSSLQVS